MITADDDTALGIHAVVENTVVLEDIAMSAHGLRLIAEEDAGLRVADHRVATEEIVRILVANGNTDPLVTADLVVFEKPVPHAPADEQAVAAVAQRAITPHHRRLRTAAGMQAEPGVVLGQAIFHGHTIRNLEADAIAVVVADGAVANRDCLAFEQ